MSAYQEAGVLLDKAVKAYQEGRLKKAKAVEEMVRVIVGLQNETSSRMDQLAERYGASRNYTTLTTNTTGHFSLRDFDGINAFWVGHTTSCVAVAVLNPEIGGMGGAHLNTMTLNDVHSNMADYLGKGDVYAALAEALSGGQENFYRTMISPSSRQQTCNRAIGKAVDEFNTLRRNPREILPFGTFIGITGIFYLDPAEQARLTNIVERHVLSNYGRRVTIYPHLPKVPKSLLLTSYSHYIILYIYVQDRYTTKAG